MIQDCVIRDYYEEIERAKQPGYVSRYDDFDFEYSDAPRSRPARFDQPHAYPAASSRTSERKVPMQRKAQRQAAFSQQRQRRRYGDARAPPPAKEGFGAGIFPG